MSFVSLNQFVGRAKRILLTVGFLFGLVAVSVTAAQAHAIVKPESLDESLLVPYQAASIVLQFNAAIHVPLSRVYLLDVAGKEHLLTARPGDASHRLIVDLPGLAPGPYALRYRVLASDGHYTDNALRFRVRAKL